MICWKAVSVTVLLAFQYASGYQMYQDQLPNGGRVPHPCLNEDWPGVGHEQVGGGGARNSFGQDFANSGRNWTAVCNLDSDGDGQTNGEELGDPQCAWVKGGPAPARSTNLTHPGVCEPLNSTKCMSENTFDINCDSYDRFDCLTHDSGVENVTFSFGSQPIPSNETTYMCQSFDFPHDRPYHIIGDMASIDNAQVMHHILLYGCEPGFGEDAFLQPTDCRIMMPENCQKIVSAWTLGEQGECRHSDIGRLAGYKRVILQYHWNNPFHVENQTDASNFTVFFTPNLRAINASTVIAGTSTLMIPPGRKSVPFTSVCSAECTEQKLEGQVMHVINTHLHMHLLGTSGTIEQWRNGSHLATWYNRTSYSYNTPVTLRYEKPFEMLPGDEIKVTCVYGSLGKTTVTRYGDGTQDEMCFAFIGFYPALDFNHCVMNDKFGGLDSCTAQLRKLNQRQSTTTSTGDHLTATSAIITLLSLMSYMTCA